MLQPSVPPKVPPKVPPRAPPRALAAKPPPLRLLAVQQPPTQPPQPPRANKSGPSINPTPAYASVFGAHWAGIDHNVTPAHSRPPTYNEPLTRRPNFTPETPVYSKPEQQTLPQYPVSKEVPPPNKNVNQNEQSRTRSQQLSQQEAQRLQLEADHALAAQLEAEDSVRSGWLPTAGGVDGLDLAQILGDDGGDQDMTSFFEEQQSLLVAYSLQAQEFGPRSEDLEHAWWLQQRENEYNRQIEEQAEFARKIQEQLAEEDRKFLENLRKEEAEKEAERKRQEAERKRREEEERKRRERMADCIVCGEEFEKTAMLITACNHAYCTGAECLQGMFSPLIPH